jgi:hypothetical protein
MSEGRDATPALGGGATGRKRATGGGATGPGAAAKRRRAAAPPSPPGAEVPEGPSGGGALLVEVAPSCPHHARRALKWQQRAQQLGLPVEVVLVRGGR